MVCREAARKEDRSCKQNEFEGLRPCDAIRDHLLVVRNGAKAWERRATQVRECLVWRSCKVLRYHYSLLVMIVVVQV